MRVCDLMTVAVIAVPPETPVMIARERMERERIRHLLVTDPTGELLGIITDRDIRLNLPSRATSLSVWEVNYLLLRLTVDQVMTKSVITVGPHRPAADAARLMLDHKIGALPVIQQGRVAGMLTGSDVLKTLVQILDEGIVSRPGRWGRED